MAVVDMVAEVAEEVTTISQEADRNTTLQHRTAIPSNLLSTMPSRMLLNTHSTRLFNIPSQAQVVIPNTNSSGLTRDNRNTRNTPVNPPSLRRTTTPTMLSTSITSSSLPTLLSSIRNSILNSSHPMALLRSSPTDNHIPLHNSQVVLRNSGVPQLLHTLLRTSLASNLVAPEVEEDTTTRPPKPSLWALQFGWGLTTVRRGILVLQ